MLLKASIPGTEGNAAIRDGSLMTSLQKALGQLKPEAAYFCEDNGERCAYVVFDMTESSQLPAVAEPFFLALNAKVTVRPVMNLADLQAAGPGTEHAVKNY
jgi:hypothetical protein